MRRGVQVVARPEIASGFALAGLPVVETAAGTEAAERVRELQRDPQAGVMLIEEPLFESLPPALRQRLARQALPMPVPFPGPEWHERPGAAESYIVDLLRQVIGYRVRLR
jgi:vacuolar-type H+-ATPase subunit F/Vma7